jgi:hypothetical protein
MAMTTSAMTRGLVMGLCLFAGTLAGCEDKEPKSPDDIESTQRTYAADYADKVARVSKNIHAREAKAKDDITAMSSFPGQLSDDVPADKVIAILDAADAAGRDEGYAEEARRIASVRGFFEDEKDTISKKVGGAAQFTAQSKSCDVDLWGPTQQGLKDGFDDGVKEKLRKHNDAFLLIDRDRDAFGKKNASALEDMADKIAEASYIVHVELPDKKKRLDFAVEQMDKQKTTLQTLIQEEKDRQTKEKLKPEDQKSSEARVKAWEAELSQFDSAAEEAKTNSKDLDDRIKKLESDYNTAFAALKESVKAGKKK